MTSSEVCRILSRTAHLEKFFDPPLGSDIVGVAVRSSLPPVSIDPMTPRHEQPGTQANPRQDRYIWRRTADAGEIDQHDEHDERPKTDLTGDRRCNDVRGVNRLAASATA